MFSDPAALALLILGALLLALLLIWLSRTRRSALWLPRRGPLSETRVLLDSATCPEELMPLHRCLLHWGLSSTLLAHDHQVSLLVEGDELDLARRLREALIAPV